MWPVPSDLARYRDRLRVPTLPAAVRVAGFWTAVVLPLAYPPLLWAGLTGWRAALFAALLACNAAALVVGHDHGSQAGAGG